MPDIDQILAAAPVIPVLVIDRLEDAVPIAEALVEGGLPVLEVTLRTPAALDAIRAMKRGARRDRRRRHGARSGPARRGARRRRRVHRQPRPDRAARRGAQSAPASPSCPASSTTGDVMRARDLGFTRLKFFPAEASGGLPVLKALAAPFSATSASARPAASPRTARRPGSPCRRSPASAAAGWCRAGAADRSRSDHRPRARRRGPAPEPEIIASVAPARLLMTPVSVSIRKKGVESRD